MHIADHKYVSLTTYRRSGEGVDVPVWIADLGDGRAGFTTVGDSGKVKRIHNNPTVLLRPCDLRGKVVEGAEAVTATAADVRSGDPDFELIRKAIGKKYGLQASLLRIGAKLAPLVGKQAGNCCILLTFPDA